jgi:hypothetical protein
MVVGGGLHTVGRRLADRGSLATSVGGSLEAAPAERSSGKRSYQGGPLVAVLGHGASHTPASGAKPSDEGGWGQERQQ